MPPRRLTLRVSLRSSWTTKIPHYALGIVALLIIQAVSVDAHSFFALSCSSGGDFLRARALLGGSMGDQPTETRTVRTVVEL